MASKNKIDKQGIILIILLVCSAITITALFMLDTKSKIVYLDNVNDYEEKIVEIYDSYEDDIKNVYDDAESLVEAFTSGNPAEILEMLNDIPDLLGDIIFIYGELFEEVGNYSVIDNPTLDKFANLATDLSQILNENSYRIRNSNLSDFNLFGLIDEDFDSIEDFDELFGTSFYKINDLFTSDNMEILDDLPPILHDMFDIFIFDILEFGNDYE